MPIPVRTSKIKSSQHVGNSSRAASVQSNERVGSERTTTKDGQPRDGTKTAISSSSCTKPKNGVTRPTELPTRTMPSRPPVSSGHNLDTRSGLQLAANGLTSTSIKPQFNTFQQHYSPAKSKASLAANDKAKLAGSIIDRRNPELDLLRTELLQLSLVHHTSTLVLQQYRNDVDTKLGIEQTNIDEQQLAVVSLERDIITAVNLAAIDEWIVKTDVHHAGRLLQDASFVIRELDRLEQSMMSSNGVLACFETWLGSSSFDRESLDHLDMAHISPEKFGLEILPTVHSHEKQLSQCLVTLAALPETLPGSSLRQLVEDYGRLAAAMRDECRFIAQMGQTLSDKHESWRRENALVAIRDIRSNTKPNEGGQQFMWDIS